MKTAAQKEANRLNAAKRRREQPEHIAAINRRCRANGGAEREKKRKEILRRERPFVWHQQFARRYNRSISAKDLEVLWTSQSGLCALTGQPLRHGEAHLDHVIPRKRGGSDDLSNLRWVTKQANYAKRDMTDEEFLALCTNVAEWIGRRILAGAMSAKKE